MPTAALASVPDYQVFRDLLDMPADIAVSEKEVHVRFHRRAHLPILIASGIFDAEVRVPWWNNAVLRFSQ